MSVIEVRVEGSIHYIAFNDPDTKNALNMETAVALYEAVTHANEDDNCQVIVFLSNARAFFSSGPSLESLIELSTLPDGALLLGEVVEQLNQIILAIYNSPKLTIAGIHGYAYGGGLNLMLACDYRIAESRSKFIENFHSMGFTPDLSASYFLPRYIGLSRTMELLLTGRLFTADEAAGWGLFHEVVEKRSAMLTRIDEFCQQVIMGEMRNLPRMKELLRDSYYSTLSEHLEKERMYLQDCLRFPEITNRLKQVGGIVTVETEREGLRVT